MGLSVLSWAESNGCAKRNKETEDPTVSESAKSTQTACVEMGTRIWWYCHLSEPKV